MELKAADLHSLGWGDAMLYGFVWENEGKDLRLFLRHASLPISELLCHRASDLRVDLNWDSGPFLTWDGSIEPSQDGRWSVFLDFADDGEIRFECEQIVARQAQG